MRAVIICSAHKVFCAGLDLDIIRGKRATETKGFLERLYFALNDIQYRMGKPTIAAVDGAVRAGRHDDRDLLRHDHCRRRLPPSAIPRSTSA